MDDNITIHSGYMPGALGRVVELHGSYYAEHWQLGLFFEAKVASGMIAFLEEFDPAKDGFWLALQQGRIVGAISIVADRSHERTARLRWFILAPEAQGQGVGNTLMRLAMDFCTQRFTRVYLTTFAGLNAARHLYEKWGFQLNEEGEDNSWGRILIEQTFEKIID